MTEIMATPLTEIPQRQIVELLDPYFSVTVECNRSDYLGHGIQLLKNQARSLGGNAVLGMGFVMHPGDNPTTGKLVCYGALVRLEGTVPPERSPYIG
jgi:hypothetical protein